MSDHIIKAHTVHFSVQINVYLPTVFTKGRFYGIRRDPSSAGAEQHPADRGYPDEEGH